MQISVWGKKTLEFLELVELLKPLEFLELVEFLENQRTDCNLPVEAQLQRNSDPQ